MLKKRLGKKGFTLVEIIVVLVILAILAAIMIPSMVGWIDKARNKSAVVEGRTLLLAAQTLASEAYATGGTVAKSKVIELAGIDVVESSLSYGIEDGAITSLAFTSTDGVAVTYTPAGGFVVPED